MVEYWLIIMLFTWTPSSPANTKPEGSFEATRVSSLATCESIKQSINNDVKNPTWAECWTRTIPGRGL